MVINIHHHGATVRLAEGGLAAVPTDEFAAHRPEYVAAYETRSSLELELNRRGRYPTVSFIAAPDAPAGPQLVDSAFEERMGEYLRATQEWAPADRPDPAHRHFIRKKRRAALFEARNKPT